MSQWFCKNCSPPLFSTVTCFFNHSDENVQLWRQDVKISWNDAKTDSPNNFSFCTLIMPCLWALFGWKFFIILAISPLVSRIDFLTNNNNSNNNNNKKITLSLPLSDALFIPMTSKIQKLSNNVINIARKYVALGVNSVFISSLTVTARYNSAFISAVHKGLKAKYFIHNFQFNNNSDIKKSIFRRKVSA